MSITPVFKQALPARTPLLHSLCLAALLGLGLAIGNSDGQEIVPGATAAPKTARPAAKAVQFTTPARDPLDQPFRLAPMAEASRSIAIPLATNLHVAFDTQWLRTHTAWVGPSLNLFGTPYRGTKVPFLCTFEGTLLWTTPPVCPWSPTPVATNFSRELAPGSRFKGLSTKGAAVTLMYDVALGGGNAVRIHETPARLADGSASGIVRRFEVGASDQPMWFIAHAEMDVISSDARGETAVVIQRTNAVLVARARATVPVSWKTTALPITYEASRIVEEKGESVVHKTTVSGQQTQVALQIPPHNDAIAVEIDTAVFADLSTADRFASTAGESPLRPPQMGFTASRESATRSAPLQRAAGEKGSTARQSGDEFYQIEPFPLPKEINLMVTGLDWISKDELAVCTWTGDIYIVEQATGPVESARYRRFARGLNEPLGLKVVGRQIYVVQKPELTRISDTDGDGEADLYETINDRWGYSGNYHAFAFGPLIDRHDNLYAFFCGQHGSWDVPYVGWCVKISPDGSALDGFCSGLRAPNGYGLYGPDDDVFIADNQGNWVGTCKLSHLKRGQFHGFPSGYPAPEADYKNPKSMAAPAVWLPRKLSPSASGLATITEKRFGPFQGQMLVGDFQNAVVLRVFLEKVNGEWQGAVWPFAKGFLSGVNRMSMGPDGKLYVGGLKNKAWAASAPREFSLERISFTGKVPFEIKEARATADGLELSFTLPVDAASARNPENYDVRQFTYEYHQAYGSPEFDHDGKKDNATPITVKNAAVSSEGLRVRLTLEGWRTGYVTWVRCLDIVGAGGSPLWHDGFYYTLNRIPQP